MQGRPKIDAAPPGESGEVIIPHNRPCEEAVVPCGGLRRMEPFAAAFPIGLLALCFIV